jgi:hypothetical protein
MLPTAPLLSTGPSSIWTPQTLKGKRRGILHVYILQTTFFNMQRDNTCRCAATVGKEVVVIRQRSAEPEVGNLALGSNSWPT